MTKTIDTLVDDIYALIDDPRSLITDRDIDELASDIAGVLKDKLLNRDDSGAPRIRPSNIGRGDRYLWFLLNNKETETFSPRSKLNFLFGDLWEAILLWFAEKSGHVVTHKQGEVTLNNITGSMDAVIDGVPVDVKTASAFNYNKFSRGSLFNENMDTYGYVAQLSFYTQGHTRVSYSDIETSAVFLATDKSGAMCLLELSPLHQIDAHARVDEVRAISEMSEPPSNPCYPTTEEDNGNVIIHRQCNYCPFVRDCFPDLRVFKYSNKKVMMSKVVNTPRVPEITDD